MLALVLLLAGAPACDTKGLEAVRAQIGDLMSPALAADALADACAKKLPWALHDGLSKLPKVSPEMSAMIAVKTVDAERTAWERVCPGHEKVAAAKDGDWRAVMFDECKLDALGTRDEVRVAEGSLPLALLAWDWMTRAGIEKETARAFARGIGGIGAR